MLQCASAQQGAAACLGLASNGASDATEDNGGVPMDVVNDDVGGKGGIGVGVGVGVGVGKGSGIRRKGKLRALQLAGADSNGR